VRRTTAAKSAKKTAVKLVGKSFKATLERVPSALNWVIIRIPFDVKKIWGKRGQLRVKGEINRFAFRTTLFPDGKGGHTMIVNKGMQRGAEAAAGMPAQFRMEPDTEKRAAIVPAELKRIFDKSRTLRRWFEQELNPSSRRDVCYWITQVKSADARVRRAEQFAERMFAVMEAERELPPILQVAFARDARAREGWELMSPKQRRRQLFGIFYYGSPEACDRRLAKVLEYAVSFAARKSNS
jgi:uncharacterized protein YdeI (YjbR/CyaY-like superfamily)